MASTNSVHQRPSTAPYLSKWLDKSRKWDIEYDGFLSNHLSHVWIVLGALHYPQSRFQQWEDIYTGSEAVHAGGNLSLARKPSLSSPIITDNNWLSHISSIPTNYPSFLNFFEAKLTSPQSIPSIIEKYLPPLLPGMAGAALHTIIQTGWGAEASHPGTVAEGLAYMSTAHQPLSTPETLWKSETIDENGYKEDSPGPIELASRYLTLARAEKLPEQARDASMLPRYKELRRGGFQLCMMAFNDDKLPLGKTLNSVGVLRLPSPNESLLPAVNECIALVSAALLGSDGEFFVIHAATSLLGVLSVLGYLEEGCKRDALAFWWRTAMAAMTVQNLPGLDDTVEILQKWEHSGGRVVGQREGKTMEIDSKWWSNALDRSLESFDEHVPKTVYVMWRWAQLEGLSQPTRDLCKDVAVRMSRENEKGAMHNNFWIYSFPSEPDYDKQAAEARSSAGDGV